MRSLVAEAIKRCKERGKYIGFCGQAPSDYPDFLQFLISQNIDAVSLNPDAIVAMKFVVAEQEKKMEGENCEGCDCGEGGCS